MNSIQRKTLGLFGLISLSLPSLVTAANVVARNDSDPYPVALADGSLVPDGSGFVSLGTFSLSDAQIMSAMDSQANLDALDADFMEFGTSASFGVAGEGGMFSSNYTDGVSAGDMFDGMSIYVVGGNGTSIGDSDQLWVFKSNESFAPDGVDDFFAEIELDAEHSAGTDLIGEPARLFLPGVGEEFDGVRMVGVIPEPSAAALGALLGLVALRRRR